MINRLSHVEVAVTDLQRARAFYCDLLGFVPFAESPEALWLRAHGEFDVWSLKLTRDDEHGLLAFGFRVDSEDRLDELATLHDRLALPWTWRAAGEEPGRGRMLRVGTPGGHVVDFEHEVDELATRHERGPHLPMRHTHARHGSASSGSITSTCAPPRCRPRSPTGRGSSASRPPSVRSIRRDRCSGRGCGALRRATTWRSAATSGSASITSPTPCATPRRSSRRADLLADARRPVTEYGPGRHGITDACFLYIRDPDGNRIELYTGDYVRDLDRPPIDWTLEEYQTTGLLRWGQQPPASFLKAGPVLDRALVTPQRDLEEVATP